MTQFTSGLIVYVALLSVSLRSLELRRIPYDKFPHKNITDWRIFNLPERLADAP